MCVKHSVAYVGTPFSQRGRGLGLFGLQVLETSHNTTRTHNIMHKDYRRG